MQLQFAVMLLSAGLLLPMTVSCYCVSEVAVRWWQTTRLTTTTLTVTTLMTSTNMMSLTSPWVSAHPPCHHLSRTAVKSHLICQLSPVTSSAQQCPSVSTLLTICHWSWSAPFWSSSSTISSSVWFCHVWAFLWSLSLGLNSTRK